MKITIKYHGQLKQFNNGNDQQTVDVSQGATIQVLLNQINVPKDYIAFVAINGERRNLDYELQEGNVAKLYQPVGGG